MRNEGKLNIIFSRNISTTDNVTDIVLDTCLYLLWGTGEISDFTERTIGALTSLIVYQPIICFPKQGFCPGRNVWVVSSLFTIEKIMVVTLGTVCSCFCNSAIRCPQDNSSFANWPSIRAGTTHLLPCFPGIPDGSMISRICTENGTWTDENFSNCLNGEFNTLH